jgi:hypothetical protein
MLSAPLCGGRGKPHARVLWRGLREFGFENPLRHNRVLHAVTELEVDIPEMRLPVVTALGPY